MLYSRLAALALAILTVSTRAFPTSTSSSLNSHANTEAWSIPSMELHMMTRLSGLPGDGEWPESTKYPSTIDFNIKMPDNHILHCYNSFANGTLPDDLAACSGEGSGVRFRMTEYTALGPRRKELSFVLEFFKVERRGGEQNITTGEVAITANDSKEPTSYLTCLLGAPFDGLRCKLHGLMSTHRELEVVAGISSEPKTSGLLDSF
ncbi:hypothetical protein SVAN01_03452 [Stagonosporopsis vannaccii]|nr:hypothetical protein SVAN01_03452 [Stagonosporopsis vannaccii]